MLFCSHIESPAHLGNKKPAWGLWWHNLSSGLWVGGWMGLNPLCHAEITFVTGVPGRPIHRLVDCRLFRMWNGFGTAACLFSKPVPPRMRRASCPFLESTTAWPHTRTWKSTACVVYVNLRGQWTLRNSVTSCCCSVVLLRWYMICLK